MTALAPGGVIGIFGGGQLGRMLALSAAQLGFDVHVFHDEAASPAARVAARETVAPYTDRTAIRAFAEACDVVTHEFESLNLAAMDAASAVTFSAPGRAALAAAQDRLAEKAFAENCGASVTPHRAVDSEADLAAAIADIGAPGIVKTRRFGYDGKGQYAVASAQDAAAGWAAMAGAPSIYERRVTFSREVSLVAARARSGAIAYYDLAENRHENGVLRETLAPASADAVTIAQARGVAQAMLERLDYVGVLTIEFFQTASGLMVNEIAPRVHNSGHWTIEGTVCSQFEQHIRAVAGWPLGATDSRGRFRMRNLLGDERDLWPQHAQSPGDHIHCYGKAVSAPGRKMGHVTSDLNLTRTPMAAD